ncbi:MAG: hypothetical protein HN712_17765 [Gemmatimonadetes bacterium]|nr:hypothetical protein [Gemmatimonadota bacterium]MBT7862169.1 hypothetical protein [Gemmatimonadota bacterium]
MSAVRTLPERASIEFLKKESRDLHKAFQAGDADAISRISTFLPRAAGLVPSTSPDDLSHFDLSRQEAQHALAGSYGCAKWEELLDTVRVQDLDALDLLSDRSVQITMREVDQRDLVRLLPSLSRASADRFYHNMSNNVQQFIRSEVAFLGEVTQEERAASQENVRRTLVELGRQGWLTWEDPDADRSGPAAVDLSTEARFAHVARPLLEVSEDELADTLKAIAEQARDLGILSLQSLTSDGSNLLSEALQYIVDGTEPDLVQDLVETRGGTILRHRTVKGHMAIEGWMSIQSGDNPAIVRTKLETYFLDKISRWEAAQGSIGIDDLVQRLRATPLLSMADEEWAELFLDMAIIGRREGLQAFEPLLELLDDEVLLAGMRATIIDRQAPSEILENMKTSLQQIRLQLKRREAMVVAGCTGIQMGHKPHDLVAAARVAAEEQGSKLLAAGPPAMNS